MSQMRHHPIIETANRYIIIILPVQISLRTSLGFEIEPPCRGLMRKWGLLVMVYSPLNK